VTSEIAALDALEILDSRGNPTLSVAVTLGDGRYVSASVPSGASTGELEARELRDGEPKRFGGKGVRRAISNIRDHLLPKLVGLDPTQQISIDEMMINLDGTNDLSRLGANAVLGVSMAVARAGAVASNLPLYQYLGGKNASHLPVPMMNVINGGLHASNSLEFQEFMIVPHGAPTFAEAMRWGAEIYHCLGTLLHEKGLHTSVGDEGGYAPELQNDEEACELIVKAIALAGYVPGAQVAIALDPAASSFWEDGAYQLYGGRTSTQVLVDLYSDWCKRFPVVSIEDGLGEHDWDGFVAMNRALGDRIQIVGDDLYVTNTALIERGIDLKATNAVLIKPNQIGTVTKTVQAIEACRRAGFRYVVSHRSGETSDSFIADFAVAMGGGQIKAGAPCRGERVAKYNRLLEIEHELANAAEFSSPFPNWRWSPPAGTRL
jgi:enolase